MNIRRANQSDKKHFDERVFNQQLAYVIEESSKRSYVSFKIFDMQKAIISPYHERYFKALVNKFLFHQGFVYQIYDTSMNLLYEKDKVTLIKVHPNECKLTQWVVSSTKLNRIKPWITSPNEVILPYFKYKKHKVILDGHSRLKVAYDMNLPYIYLYEEIGDDLSKAFFVSALKRGVKHIKDVAILSDAKYQVLWHQECDRFIDVFNQKEELRRKAFKERSNITLKSYRTKNEKLIHHLKSYLIQRNIKTVGVFYPLKKEVDLLSLKSDFSLYFPKVTGFELVFLANTGVFVEDAFNTFIPSSKITLNKELDAYLVPGLLYSKKGYRIGYGKGYYDTYLAKVKGLKIGVCFEQFLKEILPIENHDQAVNTIITESQVIEVK